LSNESDETDDIPIPSDTVHNSLKAKDQVTMTENPTLQGGHPGLRSGFPTNLLDGCKYVYFDTRNSDNVFAWMLTRRCLRKCGEPYFERCQIFNAFYLMTAFGSIALANR